MMPAAIYSLQPLQEDPYWDPYSRSATALDVCSDDTQTMQCDMFDPTL